MLAKDQHLKVTRIGKYCVFILVDYVLGTSSIIRVPLKSFNKMSKQEAAGLIMGITEKLILVCNTARVGMLRELF